VKTLRAVVAGLVVMLVMTLNAAYQTVPADAAMSLTLKTRYSTVYLKWPSQGSGKTYQVQYSTSRSFSSPGTVTTTKTSTFVGHLTKGKVYYFRVRVKGKSWSSVAKSSKIAYPKTFGGYVVQKATNISTDNVTDSRIELSWATPSGQYACFRISVTPSPKAGQPPIQCTTSYTITGLNRSTTYSIKLYTVAPAGSSGGISWPAIDITSASATIKRTTSNFPISSPSKLAFELPQRTSQATLTWEASEPAPADTDFYQVLLGSDTAVTKNVHAYRTPATNKKIVITGLTSNHAYYARVLVIDAAGKPRSDRSGYLLVKTLSLHGTLSGQVTTTAPTKSLVAVSYNSAGELDGQADVGSDGTYQLSVPPGAHKVRISYLNSLNFVSGWINGTSSVSEASTGARSYQVTNEADTALPTVTIGGGRTINGTIVDAKTGNKVGGTIVSIQAPNSAGGWETLRSTYSNGSYSFTGLAGGSYRMRVTYFGSTTYRSTNTYLTIDGNLARNIQIARR
jgi:hypothetical protein